MNRISVLIFVISFRLVTFSQQLPQFRQIMSGSVLYNPAAMTMNKQSNVSMLARWQMLGFGNEPRTISAFGHTMIKHKIKVTFNPGSRIQRDYSPLQKKRQIILQHFLGGQVISDKYGAFNSLDASGNYAVNIPLGMYWKLGVGARIGIRNHIFSPSQASVLNLTNVQLPYAGGDNTYDQYLQYGTQSLTASGSFGTVLHSKYAFVSLAVQHGNLSNLVLNQTNFFNQQLHWSAMGGYTFGISNGLDLKTIVHIKQMIKGPVSIEASAITLINFIFWAGINYQYNSSAGIIAGMDVSDNLKIGYSFDFSTNRINRFSNGGHEIYLSYGF
ncbi:MAG: type IX secretion system membrane protein PorP/SprF [Crocinitomicaceae bacterium]|nr:type IX secretion system membrane protein PorP/SprF [Crocinitomicaceae bacterium]